MSYITRNAPINGWCPFCEEFRCSAMGDLCDHLLAKHCGESFPGAERVLSHNGSGLVTCWCGKRYRHHDKMINHPKMFADWCNHLIIAGGLTQHMLRLMFTETQHGT